MKRNGPRWLIVNADDFGYAASVNAGIIDAHAGGIVTSATWLAGGEAAEEAVDLARAHPALDVGLHLALSEMAPCAPVEAAAPLLRGSRLVPDYRAVWACVRRGAPDVLRAAEAEWNAQYDRFEAGFGHPPVHVDSHQHVALLPPLQALFVRLAVARGVRWIRVPQEFSRRRLLGQGPLRRRLLPALALSVLGAQLARRAVRAGLRVPDGFAGFRVSGQATERDLRAFARFVCPGVTEWMVHPGREDTADGCRRARERAALMSPAVRADLEARSIERTTFRAQR